ncbi:MAG: hypothetical protein WCL51_04935 [Bacteroidota bacterium]
MEIIEVKPKEYNLVFNNPYHFYASSEFNYLNEDKCEKVFYLFFKDKKIRLGIIVGLKNNSFFSPFSAPFGGFTYITNDVRIQYIEQAIELLYIWAKEKRIESINITLPPAIYNESFISKQINCLFRKKYEITKIDLNYAYNLINFDINYSNIIWHNARKNLQIAQNSGLLFQKCESYKEKEIAYNIIVKNRNDKGFPLRMNWEQIQDTIKIIPSDFFIIYENLQIPIASAIAFNINKKIVQVIYWGDLFDFAGLKTMNFLSFKLFEYYKSIGKEIVDIGPSTENSFPNYGLCEFKESIGCQINEKTTFVKIIST